MDLSDGIAAASALFAGVALLDARRSRRIAARSLHDAQRPELHLRSEGETRVPGVVLFKAWLDRDFDRVVLTAVDRGLLRGLRATPPQGSGISASADGRVSIQLPKAGFEYDIEAFIPKDLCYPAAIAIGVRAECFTAAGDPPWVVAARIDEVQLRP